MLISKIAEIAANREKAKEIQERVQKRRETGDYRTFGEILHEEIKKATKDTAK